MKIDLNSNGGPLPSPCIDICQMDERSGLCVGCARTIDEIVEWAGAGEARKRAIWELIQQRQVDAFPPLSTPSPKIS